MVNHQKHHKINQKQIMNALEKENEPWKITFNNKIPKDMEAQPLKEKWIFTTNLCNYVLVTSSYVTKNPLFALNKLHAPLVPNKK